MKRVFWIAVLAFVGLGMAQDEPGIIVSIQGQWKGKAKDGTEVKYTFTKDGCVTWYVGEENFKKAFPNGLKAKYAIRIVKPYAEIDIFDFEAEQFKKVRFLGIIEVLDARSFKMEGQPNLHGERPKTFTEEAIVFRPGTDTAN